MTHFGYFDIGRIVIPVSLQMGEVVIELHLREGRQEGFPISGFPRNLASEEVKRKSGKP
jgi:hypothetical protein